MVVSIRRWALKAAGDFGGLGSTAGRFLSPQGLCACPQGARLTVAVADTGNQRVQLLTDTGGFLQSAGEYGAGSEKLDQPTDVDWDGQILTVCDSRNHRLARFDSQGVYLGEVRALSGVQASLSRQPVLNFEEPRRIQKSGGGSFWVSDRGKGILFQITTTGGILQEFGDPFPLGNEGPFIEMEGSFLVQTARNRIQRLETNGSLGREVKADPPFQSIGGMSVSGQGFGVVSDAQTGLLYIIDREGKVAGTFEPAGVKRPGALSLWQDHLFLIDNDQGRVFHYQLETASPSEMTRNIELEKSGGMGAP